MIDHTIWADLWLPGPIILANLVFRQLKIIAQQYTFVNLPWEGVCSPVLPVGQYILRHWWWHQLLIGNVTVIASSQGNGSLLRGDTQIDWTAATEWPPDVEMPLTNQNFLKVYQKAACDVA